jgi:hypothetical protein
MILCLLRLPDMDEFENAKLGDFGEKKNEVGEWRVEGYKLQITIHKFQIPNHCFPGKS